MNLYNKIFKANASKTPDITFYTPPPPKRKVVLIGYVNTENLGLVKWEFLLANIIRKFNILSSEIADNTDYQLIAEFIPIINGESRFECVFPKEIDKLPINLDSLTSILKLQADLTL